MVRFRELSLTYSLPVAWAHRVRVANLSLTGAVRNLALWTRYSGSDPEVSGSQNAVARNFVTGTNQVNNDIRVGDFGAVPLPRYYVLRLNVGL